MSYSFKTPEAKGLVKFALLEATQELKSKTKPINSYNKKGGACILYTISCTFGSKNSYLKSP